MIGRDVVVQRSALADPAWDYVALGHIHKHQELNLGHQPPIVYPGSLERIDFGEEKEEKGFVIAEVTRGNTSWTFIPVDSRPFLTIRVNITQAADPMTTILDAIEDRETDEAIVRVIIKANEEQEALIDDKAIRQSLRGGEYDRQHHPRHRPRSRTAAGRRLYRVAIAP